MESTVIGSLLEKYGEEQSKFDAISEKKAKGVRTKTTKAERKKTGKTFKLDCPPNMKPMSNDPKEKMCRTMTKKEKTAAKAAAKRFKAKGAQYAKKAAKTKKKFD